MNKIKTSYPAVPPPLQVEDLPGTLWRVKTTPSLGDGDEPCICIVSVARTLNGLVRMSLVHLSDGQYCLPPRDAIELLYTLTTSEVYERWREPVTLTPSSTDP